MSGKFNNVETFVFFIGYPRSGHSLIGACIDAHPNAVISHELDALEQLKKGLNRIELFEAICKKSNEFYEMGSQWSGYSYRIPEMWQAKEKIIKVIGDKRGGASVKHLETNPELLDKAKELAKNCRMIHVTRNPFDCIATSVLRQEKVQERKFTNGDVLAKAKEFFNRSQTIESIIKKERNNVINIRYENLFLDSYEILNKLCNFLGLTPYEDYIQACRTIIWPNAHLSRNKLDTWEESTILYIEKKIRDYSFLEGYNFKN